MYSSLRFAFGDTYDMLRETARDFAKAKSPRAPPTSTATTCSRPICGASSAIWACWA